MKRVQFACLEQTIHFQLKDELSGHAAAVQAVQEELRQYKAQLDRKKIRYVIPDESTQPDGSIIIRIKRQYNNYDCGSYLD